MAVLILLQRLTDLKIPTQKPEYESILSTNIYTANNPTLWRSGGL